MAISRDFQHCPIGRWTLMWLGVGRVDGGFLIVRDAVKDMVAQLRARAAQASKYKEVMHLIKVIARERDWTCYTNYDGAVQTLTGEIL